MSNYSNRKWIKIKWISKITERIYIPALLIILLISLVLFGFSLYKIISNEILISLYTSDGFNKFLDIFKFPIAMLASAVVIITLLNSAIKYLWLNEQLNLNRHHINMNNYYKHMEEFTNMIFDLKESIQKGEEKNIKTLSVLIESITKQDCRKLYFHWYGKKFDSTNNVLDEIKKAIKRYYGSILECKNDEELSRARFAINTMRPDLGFTEIDKRVVSDYIDYYDYSYIYIIENILEFSDDIIKDDSGNALGLLVQKHLFEIAYSKKIS